MTARAGPPILSPLILIAARDELFRRSLESVVSQSGYRVSTATDEESTLLQARSHRPDGVIIDSSIAQPPHYSFCNTLRIDSTLSATTPILVTTHGSVTRTQQLDALRAGAWELRGDPLDPEELILRLGVYISAKIQADHVETEGLVDQVSGLYNTTGVLRRSQEMAAFSVRQRLPLSCVVFRMPNGGKDLGDGDRLAGAFKREGRVSDAIGRTGPNEITVFAPATDSAAVAQLIERLGSRVAIRARLERPLETGFSTSSPASVDPKDLLDRARRALGAR